MTKTPKNYFGLFLLFLFINSGVLMAQDFNSGQIHYTRTGDWIKMQDHLEYLSESEKEKNKYLWKNQSTWTSKCDLFFDSLKTKYLDAEKESENAYWSSRKSQFFVFHDLAAQKLIEVQMINDRPYVIEDSLYCQNWKILNDMKEVAGHICMNASWQDTLKKQSIVAWFALDIPRNLGPEYFCGLPGAILEVDINNGAMIIVATKIELKEINTELDLRKKIKGKRVSSDEYRQLLNKTIQNLMKMERPYFWGMRY